MIRTLQKLAEDPREVHAQRFQHQLAHRRTSLSSLLPRRWKFSAKLPRSSSREIAHRRSLPFRVIRRVGSCGLDESCWGLMFGYWNEYQWVGQGCAITTRTHQNWFDCWLNILVVKYIYMSNFLKEEGTGHSKFWFIYTTDMCSRYFLFGIAHQHPRWFCLKASVIDCSVTKHIIWCIIFWRVIIAAWSIESYCHRPFVVLTPNR